MKKLLTLSFLLFIIMGVYGQEKIEQVEVTQPIRVIAKSDYDRMKPDTIAAILLVSDTTSDYDKYIIIDTAWNKDGTIGHLLVELSKDLKAYPQDTGIKWMKGYRIMPPQSIHHHENWLREITYLDDKKKPLPPSIIVWMAK